MRRVLENQVVPVHFKTDGLLLINAAANGKAHVVRKCLEEGGDVNYRDSIGRTALHHASSGDYPDVISELLDRGADVNCQDNCDATPLHLASDRGHLETVKTLLSRGANANCQDNEGGAPLHVAADTGPLGIVLELFKHNVNVNIQDKSKRTPLHFAVAKCRLDVTLELLKHDIDVNVPDDDGWTPLQLAALMCYIGDLATRVSGSYSPYSSLKPIAKELLMRGSENTVPSSEQCIQNVVHIAAFYLEVILEQLKSDLRAIRTNSESAAVRAKMDLYTKEQSSWKKLLLAPYHLLPGYLLEFTENTTKVTQTMNLCIGINGVLKEIAHAVHLSEYGRRMAEETAELDASGYNKTNSH
jgi:ankyrin repeat protein